MSVLELELSEEMREFKKIVREMENPPKPKVYSRQFPPNAALSGKRSTSIKKMDEFEELELAIKALEVAKEDDVTIKANFENNENDVTTKTNSENKPIVEERLEVKNKCKNQSSGRCNKCTIN